MDGGVGCRQIAATLIAMALAAITPSRLYAEPPQDAPKSAPRDPHVPDERPPHDTLSERLDRNKGVLHPPSGVDPGIAVPVPDPHPNTTPVIPPPGTPGGAPSVEPK